MRLRHLRLPIPSILRRCGSVVRTITELTGESLEGIQIVGGGSRNDYLNQVTATVAGLPVIAGPAEATVVGNIMVQAVARGRFASLSQARQYVAQNVSLKRFVPQPSAKSLELIRRYNSVEQKFLG